MTIVEMLATMKSIPDSSVWLHSSNFTKAWTCSFEIDNIKLALKIKQSGDDPLSAILACYEAFLQTGKSGIAAIVPNVIEHKNTDTDITLSR